MPATASTAPFLVETRLFYVSAIAPCETRVSEWTIAHAYHTLREAIEMRDIARALPQTFDWARHEYRITVRDNLIVCNCEECQN